VINEISFKANAVINFEYTKKIPVMDSNGGNLGFMQNDEELEDYLALRITRDSLNLFYVKAINEVSETSIEGWIEKAQYIGIYARNYEEGQLLNLYEEPSKDSKIQSTVREWIPDLYSISRFSNGWFYVSISYAGVEYTGWLEPEMQCPDSYSTCS
jgi:hypothetical protein